MNVGGTGASPSLFWGKSNAGGRPHRLLQHLFDAAAVSEILWDEYLAPVVRERVDLCCDGAGRTLFALLCGLHDVGKASPAFQSKVRALGDRVQAAGLTWGGLSSSDRNWHHTLAGAVIVDRALAAAGWPQEQVDWILPMITGHHGRIPNAGVADRESHGHGRGPAWRRAQADVLRAVTDALGVDLAMCAPTDVPSRATQLTLSGAIIMADWIASGDKFTGIDDPDQISMERARWRAADGWHRLGLRGGWRDRSALAAPGFFRGRFDRVERPTQTAAIEAAYAMPAGGLMLIEAPMGEGKTEAAFAVAEVLAARVGADGVFVGMPTQATSDAMFKRAVDWAEKVDPHTPPGLLHGKRRFNKLWHAMQRQTRYAGIDDDFGCGADPYGVSATSAVPATVVPAEWFLGPKRGLLMPVTIGTIDQLLLAATRTRHVMLRHLGLAGRVVVLDEVHAADVYMMRFITEALRWLGDARVPVVLLSATLPPSMRVELSAAYLQGMLRTRKVAVPDTVARPAGYPAIRWLTEVDGRPVGGGADTAPWRPSQPVTVEILDEGPREGPENVTALVRNVLAEGGCALVVRNTVGRAQRTYLALKKAYEGTATEVVLLHARLAMGERIRRTERVLDLLGAPDRDGAPQRPPSFIVVATQLAEQSFDVDVDLLVSDLAPIDLLLQRTGRVHRHDRPAAARPGPVSAPRVVVVGMRRAPAGPPTFPAGSEYVYHRHPLLRAAALVCDGAAAGTWQIPAQVPALVQRGYADDRIGPDAWQTAMADAADDSAQASARREANADQFLLAGCSELHRTDLAGLHDRHTSDIEDDDDAVRTVVRDGPATVEVVLLRRSGEIKRTLDGRSLGPGDTAISDPDVVESVLNSAVRLPPRLTDAALRDLLPLAEAGNDAWLARTRVLELDTDGSAVLGGRRLTYHSGLGLLDEPAP